jgi:hypothetical protein
MVPVRELGGDGYDGHCVGASDSSAEEIGRVWTECRRITLWQMSVAPNDGGSTATGSVGQERQDAKRREEAKGEAKGAKSEARGAADDGMKAGEGPKGGGEAATAEAKSTKETSRAAEASGEARATAASITRVPYRLAGLPHHLPPLVLRDGQIAPHLRMQQ